MLVNDVHAQLNPTQVARVLPITTLAQIQAAIHAARAEDRAVCIAGHRHAMGGQQFAEDGLLLDLRGFNRVLAFDPEQGQVEVEAGIDWPTLIDQLARLQSGTAQPWGIIQKQTGADRLTLGGALAANVHGRGLTMRPIIADVESFVLVDAQGEARTCSRAQNPDLFRLAIGGYGLFGVIVSIRLRLAPRSKVRRDVLLLDEIDQVMPAFEQRIAAGYSYGDFQFDIDPASPRFLERGVFSCYLPVPASTPIPPDQRELSVDDWMRLGVLAHTDKAAAYELYTGYYRASDGQIYWSDTHQLSTYLDDYHRPLDTLLQARVAGSEMITELYVPRAALPLFMRQAADLLRGTQSSVIYGTVRLIEQDDESFLAWARANYVCIIFNLHMDHDAAGLEQAQTALRGLIDLAIGQQGSFYLTYHRFAGRAQLAACYPQFPQFLAHKLRHDPGERFQSEWYRHLRDLFEGF
jgi:FAD/FMN-containing dehydrogenase